MFSVGDVTCKILSVFLAPFGREATKMSQKASSAAKGSSKSKAGGSKSKGGFLSRQAKAGKKIPLTTEAELLAKRDAITSKDVLGLEVATQGEYRCQTPPSQSR